MSMKLTKKNSVSCPSHHGRAAQTKQAGKRGPRDPSRSCPSQPGTAGQGQEQVYTPAEDK